MQSFAVNTRNGLNVKDQLKTRRKRLTTAMQRNNAFQPKNTFIEFQCISEGGTKKTRAVQIFGMNICLMHITYERTKNKKEKYQQRSGDDKSNKMPRKHKQTRRRTIVLRTNEQMNKRTSERKQTHTPKIE